MNLYLLNAGMFVQANCIVIMQVSDLYISKGWTMDMSVQAKKYVIDESEESESDGSEDMFDNDGVKEAGASKPKVIFPVSWIWVENIRSDLIQIRNTEYFLLLPFPLTDQYQYLFNCQFFFSTFLIC